MDRTKRAHIEIIAALASAAALTATSCAKPAPEPIAATSSEAPLEASAGYRKLESGAEAVDPRYPGGVVAAERWADASGESLVVLRSDGAVSSVALWKSGPGKGPAAAGAPAAQEFRFPSEPASTGQPERRSGFYRNGAWAADLDGDGYGELMLVAWVDPSPEPGPVTLELVVLSSRGTYRVSGSAAYDPPGGERVPASGMAEAALSGLDPRVRDEALKLWAEARFELAEPAPFAGFADHLELDGARFSGDKPSWTLLLLPSRMELGLGEGVAPISYDSIRAEGSGWVIEGSGRVEAWDHRLRVSISPVAQAAGADGAGSAPVGAALYSALVELSDGSRLEGQGSLSAR